MCRRVRRVGHHKVAILATMFTMVALLSLGGSRFVGRLPAAESDRVSATEGDSKQLARQLIGRAAVERGVCAVIGCDGNVAVELARSSELMVHVRDPRAAAVDALRLEADAAGFGIDRLVVEQGVLDRLPYADNMIDVVVATAMSADKLSALRSGEVLRVLRPEGVAILGNAALAEQSDGDIQRLKQWALAGGAERVEAWRDAAGTWVQFYKPALQGTDQWSHWEHGPDNNPVSTDEAIKAPYLTQFYAGPLYIGMPAITTAAGGRTFLAIGHIAHHRREWEMVNKLIARNGYNGTVLWQRALPEGYLVHRSAFIATEDTFHIIDGDRCLLLDPQTGKEQGEIRLPGVEGHWKWMAMKDGVLYVLTGAEGPGTKTIKGDRTFGGWSWADLSRGYYTQPRVPWGFGHTLAAYDLKEKRLLWKHEEKSPVDSRAMSIGKNKVFVYCPQRHLRCLEAATGRIVWTNDDSTMLGLIEQPGRGLASTPGFRSCCLAVSTPDALVLQGQTRMNVVAISPEHGSLLWTKKKTTNNPNVVYVDGRIILGVGAGGSHVALDPISGEELEDLKFRKVSCVRLTATPDSFFCRGEGTLRFDRRTKKVVIDGAIRPACNDGAFAAGGILYLGPWQCDCNLSLIGAVGKCSAGDFRFDHVATEADRLERATGDDQRIEPLSVAADDWPTYRANNRRTAAAKVAVARPIVRRWEHRPDRVHVPTPPTAAGGLVFCGGDDGKVRALEADSGAVRWVFATAGPIKMPPTICNDRAYVGSGDGYVYALEAATGRLLWRFRAAPVERHIMVYQRISSTWPVHSGVLVHDGVAYFAAGIIDSDGTYVYALDANTGRIKWQNNSSGHLSPELRKGVSAQGIMTIQGDRLLLAGGNQVSPAPFDLETGECLAAKFGQGQPKANHGQFVGVFRDKHTIAGGRILHSAPENVSNKGSFVAVTNGRTVSLNFGGIPPAWDESTMALVNFRHGKLTCCDAEKVAARIEKGFPRSPQGARRWQANLAALFAADGAVRWQSDLGEPNKFEALSLVVCRGAVVAVVQYQQKFRAHPQWFVVACNARQGAPLGRQELSSQPLPGGLLVDRSGQVIVTMLDGSVLCLGARG